MTDADRWSRLKHHFESIRSLTTEEAERYLDTHCAGDQKLRDDLLRLVDSHHDTTVLPHTLNLNELVFGAAGTPHYETGDQIDKYEICDLIDTGGMGDVYLARRTSHYEDELAIKVIRASIATPTMIDRFRRERQTLALLDHPGITRILDGGTTPNGLPYIVMEYVRGVSITKFCCENRCGPRKIIELFISACDAVQNAHQNLVIHRDIKPGNILVTDQGAVKLLDFGIAAAPEDTADDAPASSLPITLGSSSPEQLSSEPVGTTTDVYSLGVVLYELIAGTAPFMLDSLSRSAAVEHICRHEPAPPSERGVCPPHWRPDRPRELDAIVRKAMRKNPDDRYQSVGQLSEDLRRYLRNQPVDAFASSQSYRFRKLIVRNRRTSVLIGVLATALFLAGVITTGALIRTRAAHAESERQRDDAQETIAFLQTMLAQANPYTDDEPMSVEDALREADALVESELADRPAVAARVRLAVGRVYMDLFMYDRAELYLSDALAQFSSLPNPIDDATLADCMALLARARSDLVWTRDIDCTGVVAMQQRVLTIHQGLSDVPNPDIATALGDLALAHWAQRPQEPASDQVVDLYQQSLAMFDELGLRRTADAAENDVGAGHAYASRGQDALAELHFRTAMASYEQSPEHRSPFYLQSVNACAQLLRRTGRSDEAARLFAVAIERSPERLIVTAELEARWGSIQCAAESGPEVDQNAALLKLLDRQVKMYLQDDPDNADLLSAQRSIHGAEPPDAPDVLRGVWPAALAHQQRVPRALPDHIRPVVVAGFRLYGGEWMLATLDHASRSEQLEGPTLEVLALFRARIEELTAGSE